MIVNIKNSFSRILAMVLVLLNVFMILTACDSGVKSVVGSKIDPLETAEKSFTNLWITDKKTFMDKDEEWRVGFVGNSVKITSGGTAGAQIWYTGKALSKSWVINTAVSFKSIKKGESSASIILGSENKEAVLTVTLTRKETGEIGVIAESLIPAKKTIAQADFHKTDDTTFNIIISNKTDDKKIRIYVTGDNDYSYNAETEIIDQVALDAMNCFGYSTTASGINFQDIALNASPNESNNLLDIAIAAQNDMYKNFWTGSPTTGNIMKEDHGYLTTGKQTMIWAHAMMLFGMEAMYDVTGDEEIKDRITAQWNFTKENFTEEQLVRPGQSPNIAVDDAGWDAMAYMLFYRITKDEYALKVTKELIDNSYEFWKDGEIGNGLWYLKNNNTEESQKWKSIYSTGLMLAALEYYEVKKDEKLLSDTLALYQWIEENLLRNGKKVYGDITVDCSDNLYWADFNVDRETRTEKNGPDGGLRPNDINEAGSVSFLGGNMAMAVIHAKLFKITGDEKYKLRALETVKAINVGPYNKKGIYVNDRDAWTTAAFMKWWVQEVLTLPGITEEDKAILKNTAISIYNSSRTSEGFYDGSWSVLIKGSISKWTTAGSKPEQLMTSANSANVIFAAALMEKIG